MSYLLGLDIGSSSVKASLIEADTGKVMASAVSSETELGISAPYPGWAEQDPEIWWKHVKLSGINKSPGDAFVGLKIIKTIKPNNSLKEIYQVTYQN